MGVGGINQVLMAKLQVMVPKFWASQGSKWLLRGAWVLVASSNSRFGGPVASDLGVAL